jgi:hypothetical protein
MDNRGKHINGLIILAVLATAGLIVPGTGAVFPGGHEAWPIVTAPDLNISGIDVANSTMPVKYQTSPVPIRMEVTISETLIPGPKGEMQAGPRSIGFTTDPLSLLILVVAIIAGAAGVWYLVKRKPVEAEEEDDEKNGD